MSNEEFNTEVINMRSRLMTIAWSLTGNKDDAKDLVQDTYVKIYRYKKTIMSYDSMHGAIIRMLRNTFINNYRLSLRMPQIDREKDILHFDGGEYPPIENILSVKDINAVVGLLPSTLRPSFRLHIEGYMHKEIAQRLHLPVGTVKSHVCRARKRTTQLLIKNGY